MTDYGKVSIIMPNYNGERFIGESIESVLEQSYTNWELLIVDDCSTDKSAEIIRSYAEKDERIKLFIQEKNGGAAAARNRALREATGKWVAFLDSDDLWLPQKLEKQLVFMADNGYKFSFTKYCQIDETGNGLGKVVTGPKKITKRKMFHYCYPGCLTVIYSADVGVVQIPDDMGAAGDDYAIWLKVAKKYTCYLLDEILSQYRLLANSFSHGKKLSLLIKNIYRLFRKSEKRSAFVAAYYTFLNCWYGVWKKLKYEKKVKSK